MSQALEAKRLSLRSYAPAQESHSHAHHQVILPLQGRMALETDRAGAALDETGAAVVTSGREHAFRGLGENRVLILDVPAQGCGGAEALWDRAADRPFLTLDERLRGLLDFARLSTAPAFAPAAFRSSLGTLILQGLAQRACGGPEPDALLRATAFIHQRFAEPIGGREIAAAAGVSEATLRRLFAAWHGSSPVRYLGGLRLAKARSLLQHSRRPIAQIALDCGYSEQSALTRALRREAGVTPAQLRRHGQPNS